MKYITFICPERFVRAALADWRDLPAEVIELPERAAVHAFRNGAKLYRQQGSRWRIVGYDPCGADTYAAGDFLRYKLRDNGGFMLRVRD